MSSTVAHLEFRGAHGLGRVTLRPETTSIGRQEANLVRLTSAAVSKRHAEISYESGHFVLRDLGSRNGTFVNGEPLAGEAARPLKHGDWIQFGGTNAPEAQFLLGDRTSETRGTDSTAVLFMTPLFVDALRALRPGHGLDDLLAVVLDSTIALSGAQRGFIMLADARGELAFRLARSSRRETLTQGDFETTSRTIPRQVLDSGQTFVTQDLRVSGHTESRARTVRLGLRSVVCLPLISAEFTEEQRVARPPRRIGVLYLDSTEPGTLLSQSTRVALETLTAEAAIALDNAILHRAAVEKVRLEDEMRRAAEIQRALLPAWYRAGEYYTLAASMQPCRAIGGDFFDYVERGGEFHVLMGDVAGKGTAAALQAALVQGVFTSHAATATGPAQAVATINQVLCNRATLGRLATLFYAVLTGDGRLTYCNAGHCQPLLVSGRDVRRLDVGGCPVGAFAEAAYEQGALSLEEGDMLLMFTDGVTEACADPQHEGEQFGDRQLIELATASAEATPSGVLERLIANLDAFTAGTPQVDDVTALALRYRR